MKTKNEKIILRNRLTGFATAAAALMLTFSVMAQSENNSTTEKQTEGQHDPQTTEMGNTQTGTSTGANAIGNRTPTENRAATETAGSSRTQARGGCSLRIN